VNIGEKDEKESVYIKGFLTSWDRANAVFGVIGSVKAVFAS